MNVCDETPDSNGMLLSPAWREVRVERVKVATSKLNGITNAIAANTSRAAQSPSTAGDYSTAHKPSFRAFAIARILAESRGVPAVTNSVF